jgi:hypothetical protein
MIANMILLGIISESCVKAIFVFSFSSIAIGTGQHHDQSFVSGCSRGGCLSHAGLERRGAASTSTP